MTRDKETQLETALATLPRVQLASIRPTPLEQLPRLSAQLGGPDIYIKRDGDADGHTDSDSVGKPHGIGDR